MCCARASGATHVLVIATICFLCDAMLIAARSGRVRLSGAAACRRWRGSQPGAVRLSWRPMGCGRSTRRSGPAAWMPGTTVRETHRSWIGLGSGRRDAGAQPAEPARLSGYRGAAGKHRRAVRRGDTRVWFAIGAVTASAVWFYGLGLGARWLAPLFRKPMAWRVLDLLIGCVMWAIAASLVLPEF